MIRLATPRAGAFLFVLISLLAACSKKDSTPSSPNRPPALSVVREISGLVGERLSVQVQATDPDGDRLTITAQGLPPSLSYNRDSARIIGTLQLADTGIHNVRVIADDGKSQAEAALQIQVFRDVAARKTYLLARKLETSMTTLTPSLPGVALSVITADGQTFSVARGTRVVGSTAHPLQPVHRFRIASATKPMVAAMILKLAEQGKLELDKPVSQYINNPVPNGNTVTIRQLLNHTAGLYDHLNANSFWNHPANNSSKVWSLDEIITLGHAAGPLFAPGTQYAYSNTGYVVLGKVIEQVTGLAIRQAFQQLLFTPVGMPSGLYDDSPTVPNTLEDLATNSRSYEYSPTAAGPSGAVVCNAIDLAKFGRAVYGASFINNQSVQAMIQNYGAAVGGQNYGLGTRLWDLNGIKHHGHTGALMDYRSIVIYVPSKQMSMAMITHGVHAQWFTLVDDLMLYALEAL